MRLKFNFKSWLAMLCLLFLGTGSAWGYGIVKCTSTADLVAGDTYYISGAASYSTAATVMGINIGGNNFPASTFDGTPCELKLIKNNGSNSWSFSYVDGKTTYYLDPTSAQSNYLKRSTDITDYGKFSISFGDNDEKNAIITSREKKVNHIIRMNSSIYSCYTSGQSPVYLYKKVPTISIAAACTDGHACYSTYSNANAWVVPEALTVSEIGVVDGKLNVVNYATGAVVPANTGVMVSASSGGDYTIDLSTETGTSVLGTGNCLHPSSEAMTGDNLFYRLTMHNGTQIGFWWGAADGAAFTLAANKAYLAVPKSAHQVKTSLWLTEDDEDALNTPFAQPYHYGEDPIFNLHGQRIPRMQTGINIVDGKKLLR